MVPDNPDCDYQRYGRWDSKARELPAREAESARNRSPNKGCYNPETQPVQTIFQLTLE